MPNSVPTVPGACMMVLGARHARHGVDFVPGDEALNQSPLTGGAGNSACF
jgi:hypothetical protein